MSMHDVFSTHGVGTSRLTNDFTMLILTGPETASAAELFAYTLRSYGKASTAGQGTTGIAHLVRAQQIKQHFVGRFSTYRNATPVTNSDWEGVGLVPDTYARPEDSRNLAIRLATAPIGDRGSTAPAYDRRLLAGSCRPIEVVPTLFDSAG